jgi:glutathione S-transferase
MQRLTGVVKLERQAKGKYRRMVVSRDADVQERLKPCSVAIPVACGRFFVTPVIRIVMKLYYSPGACSLSPHIVLREAGLPVDLVLASTKTKKLADGSDYLAINPKGQVPLLELDNGERLSEGPAIVQYIADQVPAKQLAPAAGTMERYRLIEWLNFVTSELHKGFSPLFSPDTPEDYKPVVRARLLAKLAYVNERLEGRQYLLGDQFSVADAYLFVVSGWGQYVGVDISGLAHLESFRARVAARPAVQEALRAEGLLK